MQPPPALLLPATQPDGENSQCRDQSSLTVTLWHLEGREPSVPGAPRNSAGRGWGLCSMRVHLELEACQASAHHRRTLILHRKAGLQALPQLTLRPQTSLLSYRVLQKNRLASRSPFHPTPISVL